MQCVSWNSRRRIRLDKSCKFNQLFTNNKILIIVNFATDLYYDNNIIFKCFYQYSINILYLLVVAPPIRSGVFIPLLVISVAIATISRRDGVIRPRKGVITS